MKRMDVTLLVKKKSDWEEIVEKETYTITYMQVEGEQPMFVEVVREQGK